MGIIFTRLAAVLNYWPVNLIIPRRTNEERHKKRSTNSKHEEYELPQLSHLEEEKWKTHRSGDNQLRTRNEELEQQLYLKEEELKKARIDINKLRMRISEVGAMQLIEGNPNITDLSDQNRADKIAEQFSELYDNQWTDCYQVLYDQETRSEQETVGILLTILKTTYDISLNKSQEIMRDAREVLLALAGKSDGKPEEELDRLIQETLYKMKSYRTKHFKAVSGDVAKEIHDKLVETIGNDGVKACREYIDECVRICWLMCIKDPPMYIFCEKEDVFNKAHFMEYTETGYKVSYVVWPALYLHQNGPLMSKGVAQGEGKKPKDSKEDEDGSPKFDDFVEKKPQCSTGTDDTVQPSKDVHRETELSDINERIPCRVSPTTLEDISLTEPLIEQQEGTKFINTTVAEGNPSLSKEDGYLNLIESADSDTQTQFQDVIRSPTENNIIVESSLQGEIEIIGNENILEGNATTMTESEQLEYTSSRIESIYSRNNGEENIEQNQEARDETEQPHASCDIVATDKEYDSSRGEKETEDKITGNDQAVEQVKSIRTDTNCPTEGIERQIDAIGKQVDIGTGVQLLAGQQAGNVQPTPDDLGFINDEQGQDDIKENQEGVTEITDTKESKTVDDDKSFDGDKHVEIVQMGVGTPIKELQSKEHENDTADTSGRNSNNSADSNNQGKDITFDVEKENIVQTANATGEKIQENKDNDTTERSYTK